MASVKPYGKQGGQGYRQAPLASIAPTSRMLVCCDGGILLMCVAILYRVIPNKMSIPPSSMADSVLRPALENLPLVSQNPPHR